MLCKRESREKILISLIVCCVLSSAELQFHDSVKNLNGKKPDQLPKSVCNFFAYTLFTKVRAFVRSDRQA